MSTVPVRNRRELRGILETNLVRGPEPEVGENIIEEPTEETMKLTKSQILESNLPFENYVARHERPFTFSRTEDSTLWNVISNNSIVGYLDISNPRLWILHSIGYAKEMKSLVYEMTAGDGSMIDFPWFASDSLDHIGHFGETGAGFSLKYRNEFVKSGQDSDVEDMTMRFWGAAALELIDQLRRSERIKAGLSLSGIGLSHKIENGYVKEQVSSDGRITAIKGDSIDSHFSIISKIQHYYQTLLNRIENEYRFSYEKKPHGVAFKGEALEIRFERRIVDLISFAESMFSTFLPFRLWGVIKSLGEDSVKVKAVDLHTGGRIDFEIGPDQMMLYLQEHACANVITRLFANLQSSYDAQSKLLGQADDRII